MTLKRLIKDHPQLFYLWYHLYRKWRGVKIDYFDSQTELYFDGFPRSGNTFALHLISKIWPDMHIVHHFHAIAAVKIALANNIPTFILLRDPLNAISSWYLKELSMQNRSFKPSEINHQFLKSLVIDYYHYYKWISNNLIGISIIKFEALINEPASVMLDINNSLNGDFEQDNSKVLMMAEKLKDDKFGAKVAMGSSLPNEEKEKAKRLIQEEILKMKEFSNARKIHEEILDQI